MIIISFDPIWSGDDGGYPVCLNWKLTYPVDIKGRPDWEGGCKEVEHFRTKAEAEARKKELEFLLT